MRVLSLRAGGIASLSLVSIFAVQAARAAESVAEEIVVYGRQDGSLTQGNVAQQKNAVLSAAGSVGFVDMENVQGRYTNTLRDVLKDVPGVFVQSRYGQELRISMRGSSSARGYHLRGLEVLQDGVPWNLADGSGDFYEIDPLSLRSIEIYKGGNGLAFGSSTLGGAINFVTPTARTVAAPTIIRLEGGSFTTLRGSVTESHVWDRTDALVTVTGNTSAGGRVHSQSNDVFINGNLGYRISDTVESRFYVSIDDTRQQLPGSLTLSQVLTNPAQAAAASAAMTTGGHQQRNNSVQRFADRTSFKLEDGQIDVDVWAYHKHLHHPIFQVVYQDGWTWGGDARYTTTFDIGALRNELVAGGRVVGGRNTAQQYINLAGARGALTADARQKALNADAYVEDRVFVLPSVALMVGGKYFTAKRELENITAPTRSGEKVYRGFSPKFGVLWQTTPTVQVFADVTRSRDVPDFSDLTQTNTAGSSFVPLQMQRGWTSELGARGSAGPIRFDLTAYRATLRGELLQYTIDPNIPATTFNAGRTIHQGIEASASIDLFKNMTGAEDRLSATALWTLNDFRFKDDAQYGNNRIAGTPHDVVRLEVRYERPSVLGLRDVYLAPQLDWVPTGAWADQKNSLRPPGYAVLGLEAGVQVSAGTSLYVEARNLTNKAYVSDIGSAIVATASSAIFYPGERRSVYAGLRMMF